MLACTQHTRESKTPLTHFPKTPESAKPSLAKAPPPKKKKKKKIYLTFDDGPNRGTSKVLHIIQEEQVPVTFFIVGEHVFASTEATKIEDITINLRDNDNGWLIASRSLLYGTGAHDEIRI